MKFCPHCGGEISKYMEAEGRSSASSVATIQAPAREYSQDDIWRRLVSRAREVQASPPRSDELVLAAVQRLGAVHKFPLSTIVHVAFDRNIVPTGGVLYRATMLEGRTQTSPEQLEAMGYAVKDGAVLTVADVPVGQAYSAVDYWGGARQHKRWHLAEPVSIEPSRNGDPFFMDENMLAFGARWRDLERVEEGLLGLFEMFTGGIQGKGAGSPIAIPLALELVGR